VDGRTLKAVRNGERGVEDVDAEFIDAPKAGDAKRAPRIADRFGC